MKITNRTHYRTDDLRRFFEAGCRGLRASTDRRVTVEYTKQRHGSSGCASLHGNWILVRVPKNEKLRPSRFEYDDKAAKYFRSSAKFGPPFSELGTCYLRSLAVVFEHELQHNLGLEHAGGERCGGPILHSEAHSHLGSWWVGLKVRAKPSTVKPKPPREARLAALVEQREKKARKRLEEIESILRRYGKLRKKYVAKVRGYEKRKIAAITPPKEL